MTIAQALAPPAFRAALPPRFQEIFDFWLAARGARAVPLKADIDPLRMPSGLLPFLAITERGPDGRLRYRLAGTGVVAAVGREITGKYPDELISNADYLKHLLGLYDWVMSEGMCIYNEGEHSAFGGLPRRVARLMMPVSSHGEGVDMVLSMQIYTNLIVPSEDAPAELWPPRAYSPLAEIRMAGVV